MNFDVNTETTRKSSVEEKDFGAALQHLVPNHDANHANNKHLSDENLHKNSVLVASLLLPTPMNRPKSTSAVIAEKSNIWSEHKLHEKTSQLDKELYNAMLKMNADRLEVVSDLAKLKRSSSTGSFNKMHDEWNTSKTPQDKSRSKPSSPIIHRGNEKHSPTTSRALKSESDSRIRKSERASGIEIRITSDLSSDEEEISDNFHLRAVSSPMRRHCREERAQGEMVENVLRRYAKQTSPKCVLNSKK